MHKDDKESKKKTEKAKNKKVSGCNNYKKQ